jgi:hypothetical protein
VPVAKYTFEVEQGSDLTIPFYFFDPDPSGRGDPTQQVPENFTSCTAKMTIRQSQNVGSALILTLTSPSGGIAFVEGTFAGGPPVPTNPNGVAVTITAAQSEAMNPGSFWYDLFITFPDTTRKIYLSGPLVVSATVTR